jgi:hypothetical protein
VADVYYNTYECPGSISFRLAEQLLTAYGETLHNGDVHLV